MAIKTYMSKVYDRVEWDFIEAILRKMGFIEKWVGWIMKCIKTMSYHILVNGQPRGNIFPQRGLCQGDPLSPFIFILCTEALIGLLKGAEESGNITGMRVARESPPVSHFFFADESLFFCKAETQERRHIMEILNLYEKASCQCINLDKSLMLFRKQVP